MKTVISTQNGHIGGHFAVTLPFELSPGRYVIIRWKDQEEKSVSFNFTDGTSFDDKLMFHYCSRFNENAVVRNNKGDAGWGPEERGDGMPCKVGVIQETKIVVRQDFYECFHDGVKHTEFKHRMSVNLAKFFLVQGEGQIHNIVFGDEAEDQASRGLTVPFDIPCDIFPDRKIHVSGTPDTDGKKFHVILKADDDFALSIAARMKEGSVIMNNRVKGDWKTSVAPKEFPFQAGQPFNIVIYVETDKFKVFVNDQPFADFNHRILPLSKITGLRVQGDVQLDHAEVI